MADKRLVALFYRYGKINYGMALMNLQSKNLEFNYENMLKELQSFENYRKETIAVKTR